MSINVEDLKNGNLKKKFDNRKTMRIVNGKRYDRNAQSNSLTLATAVEQLNSSQLNVDMASGTTNLENSQNLLETIGCTILNSQNYQNYTLIEEETISNPNISTSLSQKKNEQIVATDMFPNSDDPFYELDGELPRMIQLENKTGASLGSQQGYIKLAENISTLNIQAGNKLKYFK
jgi:hypothetical protein